jgi:hypothetical protein
LISEVDACAACVTASGGKPIVADRVLAESVQIDV